MSQSRSAQARKQPMVRGFADRHRKATAFLCAVVSSIEILLAVPRFQEQTATDGAVTLTVRVVNRGSQGGPVNRALVTIRPESGRESSSVTNQNGTVDFSGLRPGFYTVVVEKPGLILADATGQTARSVKVRVPADRQNITVDVRLLPGAVVEGNVFFEDGRPAVAAMVQITQFYQAVAGAAGYTPRTAGTTETDDRGYFRLFGLSEGIYQIGASLVGPGWTNLKLDDQNVAIRPATFGDVTVGSPSPALRLSLGETRGGIAMILRVVRRSSIQGQVTDPAGRPVRRALLAVTPLSDSLTAGAGDRVTGITDDNGSFNIPVVQPSRYVVGFVGDPDGTGAGAYGYAEVDVVEGGDSIVAINLEKGQRISGRVTVPSDDDTSSRIVEYRVRFSPVGAAGVYRSSPVSVSTVNGGRFTVDGMMAGSYGINVTELTASPRGLVLDKVVRSGIASSARVVDLDNGVQPEIQLRLVSGGAVAGKVRFKDGTAAEGYFVVAVERLVAEEAKRYPVVTLPVIVSRAGDFRIEGLPSGNFLLAVSRESRRLSPESLDLLENQASIGLTVTVTAGQTVEPVLTIEPD